MSNPALKFALLLLIGSPTLAAPAKQPNSWLVTQLAGDARVIHPGVQPASIKVNAQILPGDTLVTGENGRATLVRHGDYILVAPHSQLRVPAEAQPDGFTRVIETLGTMLFKVQHTGIPHFAVQTPMLAAVVKGTTFTVVVEQQRSAVQVIQGVVQVTTTEGQMSRMVEGGRTVFVEHHHPSILQDADKPSNVAPSASSVRVSATGRPALGSISELTGGLVRVASSSTKLAGVPNGQESTISTAAAGRLEQKELSPAGQGLTVAVSKVGVAPAPTSPLTLGTPSTTAPGTSVSSLTPPAPTTAIVPPTLTAPTLSIANVTTPAVTAPAGPVTAPSVISHSLTTPAVTVPAVSSPFLTIPSVTHAPVSTPSVTVPTVSTPAVTTPSTIVPSTPAPAVTAPTVTTPAVTTPSVTAPAVTTPSVTTTAVSTPSVTVPSISPTASVPSASTPGLPPLGL